MSMEKAESKGSENPNDELSGDPIIMVENETRKDVMECFVKGNYTQPKGALEHEMFAGETIEHQVEVAVKVPGLKWFELCFFCIPIIGWISYFCVIKLGYCVPTKLFSERACAILTSHSRLLVWHSDVLGEKKNFQYKIGSSTDIACYSIKQLCHIEKAYVREKRCCGFLPSRNDSLLRCFFNAYPDRSIYAAKQIFPFPPTVRMVPFGTLGTYHALFGFRRTVGNIIAGNLTNPQSYNTSPAELAIQNLFGIFEDIIGSVVMGVFGVFDGLRESFKNAVSGALVTWGESHVVEIYSPYNDGLKKNGNDWENFGKLEQAILNKATPQLKNHLVGAPGNSQHWKIVSDESTGGNIGDILEDNGIVKVHPQKLGLGPEEEILDTFPMYFKWSCEDILYTILTCGIYYCLVLRVKFAMIGCLIVTRQRLIEVFSFSLTGRTDPTSDSTDPFTVSYRQYFFGRLSQGFIEFSKTMVYGHIKTKYGGLMIMPMNDEVNPCVGCYYGMNPEIRERMREFLVHFAITDTPGLLASNKNIGANADATVYKHAKLGPNENVIHILSSDHRFGCDFQCQRTFCCGCSPVAVDYDLMVTSHRVWASAEATNKPWCLTPYFSPKMDTLFWKPLSDLKATRVEGKAFYQANCITRRCGTCCHPFISSVEVEIGSNDSFPIQVSRIDAHDQYGSMARADITSTRKLLANAMVAANSYHGIGGQDAPPAY